MYNDKYDQSLTCSLPYVHTRISTKLKYFYCYSQIQIKQICFSFLWRKPPRSKMLRKSSTYSMYNKTWCWLDRTYLFVGLFEWYAEKYRFKSRKTEVSHVDGPVYCIVVLTFEKQSWKLINLFTKCNSHTTVAKVFETKHYEYPEDNNIWINVFITSTAWKRKQLQLPTTLLSVCCLWPQIYSTVRLSVIPSLQPVLPLT
jgi:hypothetical protein